MARPAAERSVRPVYGIVKRGYARRVQTHRPRRRLAFDLAVCAALLAFGISITTRSDAAGGGTAFDTVLLPVVTLPILLRHRRPFARAAAPARGGGASAGPRFAQVSL